ncbi:MAG TPA: alpha/beta fold hydrolase [Planctomycetota bacterium]|nr:alpha/beta fold hydrolase [Planctomycetota bacterium]
MVSRPHLPNPCLAGFALFAACSAVQDDLSRQLLKPPPGWLAEPGDLGMPYEPVEIALHSDASLTGFWIPHAEAKGRTVVLFHDANTNASVMHPYYAFLHEAGYSVLAFDPRGFGRSKGTPTLQAWLHDLPALFEWLRARPDVDPGQIALFGTGLGSVAALWAARTQGPCKALVLEHLPSLRDMLRESIHDDGGALSAYALGWAEFAGLPEEIEPDENAPRTKVRALFLATDQEPLRDRGALLRAYGLYGGERQLWLLAGTRHAPHAMVTHDGEYQHQIAAFLQSAFAGDDNLLATTWSKTSDASDGEAWYQIEVTTKAGSATPQAVEAAAALADGTLHYARSWLEGSRATARLKLRAPPQVISAVRVPDAAPDPRAVFVRKTTVLMRSAAAIEPLMPRIEALRNGALPAGDYRQLAADLAAAESEPFHPRLAAELGDVWARLGKELASDADPQQQALGTRLLQRAVAVAPEKPQLHVWPGASTTYGFPQQGDVDEARRLLAAPAK